MKVRSVSRTWYAIVCIIMFVLPSFAQQPAPVAAPPPPPPAVPGPRPAPPRPVPPEPLPGLAPGAPMAAPLPGRPELLPEDSPPCMVRIYALKYARSEEVAKIIGHTVIGRYPTIAVPDARTNSVIVTTVADQLKTVEELVKQLDAPSTDSSRDQVVQVFALNSARAKDLVRVLQGIVSDAAFSVDEASNKILFSGSDNSCALVTKLLAQLDQDKVRAAPTQGRRIRVVWLLSDKRLPAPPPDVNDVIDELASMGITGLGLAAQSLVQTVSSGKFSVQCTPAAFDGCRLQVEGAFQESADELPRVQLVLNASGTTPTGWPSAESQPQQTPRRPPMPPGSNQLVSITTTLMAPPGRKVLMGVTPIEQYTSVFVIQVLPGISGG